MVTLPTGKEIAEMSRQYNLHAWSVQGFTPIAMTKADGIYFWDADGKRYFDMSSQLVNVNIGYGNKKVIKAIQDQAEKLAYAAPSMAVDVKSQLAKMIIEIAPDNMGKVFFALGGSDANENAIKIARMYTGRPKFMSRYLSYHGSTFASGQLTGEPRRYTMEPGIPGFVKFFDPYVYRAPVDFASEEAATAYYLEQLRTQVIYEGYETIAAIFVETVTGSNGIIIPPKGYLQGVRKICDEFGILMVCDEVMAGFGRTGEWFAFNHFDVKPDLITFAKGITSGYVPLGGVIVSKKVAEYFNEAYFNCGMTYSGHPLGCAAGIASLEYYKETNLIQQAKERGVFLGKLLEALKERHPSVGDVRYIGLFSALELVKNKKTREPLIEVRALGANKTMKGITGMLAAKGFYTYAHRNNVIVTPPLIISEAELTEAMGILDEVLSEVDKTL